MIELQTNWVIVSVSANVREWNVKSIVVIMDTDKHCRYGDICRNRN
jgi:hypothetical protein